MVGQRDRAAIATVRRQRRWHSNAGHNLQPHSEPGPRQCKGQDGVNRTSWSSIDRAPKRRVLISDGECIFELGSVPPFHDSKTGNRQTGLGSAHANGKSWHFSPNLSPPKEELNFGQRQVLGILCGGFVTALYAASEKPLGRELELTTKAKGVGRASHQPALRPRLPKNTKNTNTPVGPNWRPCHRAGDHGRPSHEPGHGGSDMIRPDGVFSAGIWTNTAC